MLSVIVSALSPPVQCDVKMTENRVHSHKNSLNKVRFEQASWAFPPPEVLRHILEDFEAVY